MTEKETNSTLLENKFSRALFYLQTIPYRYNELLLIFAITNSILLLNYENNTVIVSL